MLSLFKRSNKSGRYVRLLNWCFNLLMVCVIYSLSARNLHTVVHHIILLRENLGSPFVLRYRCRVHFHGVTSSAHHIFDISYLNTVQNFSPPILATFFPSSVTSFIAFTAGSRSCRENSGVLTQKLVRDNW